MNKPTFQLDKIGFALSLTCAIHCAVLPLLITFLPLIGGEFLKHPQIELFLMLSSVLIAAYVLYKDFKFKHQKIQAIKWAVLGFGILFSGHLWHEIEFVFAVLGGFILVWAYLLNWKLIQQVKVCKC